MSALFTAAEQMALTWSLLLKSTKPLFDLNELACETERMLVED